MTGPTVETSRRSSRPARPQSKRHGLLLVDKPAGCTSHDIVVQARRILREKKIGHCGTLDPDATGLLVLTIGRATRLTRFLIQAPKVYEGSIRFGIATDTYDLSGQVVETKSTEHLDKASVDAAMEQYVGTYLQTPPPYCAKKINGVKYYELARRGEEVPQEKKEVTVFDFRALAGWQPGEDLPFILGCSSGTYARSLAHELGERLGCGGTLVRLRRTKVGPFAIEQAVDPEALRARMEAGEELRSEWIPFDDIPLPFGQVATDAQQENRIRHGQNVLVRELEGQEGDWVKIVDQRQRLIAVGSIVEKIGTGGVGVVQPKVVFKT